jgi:hypothetical protein
MIVAPAIFFVAALYLLGIGLRGAVGRKPFLISSRWMLGIVLLTFLLQCVQQLLLPHRSVTVMSPFLITLAMFAVLTVFLWRSLRGYTAFGITGESVRGTLLASLKTLNLPFEESLSAIHLPSEQAELQVSVQTWLGSAQIRIAPAAQSALLGKIVAGMNGYYRTAAAGINMTSCYLYLALGVLIVVMALRILLGMHG